MTTRALGEAAGPGVGWPGGLAAKRLGGWAILTWEITEGPLDHLRPWVSSCDIFCPLSRARLDRKHLPRVALAASCISERAAGGPLAARVGVGWSGGWVARWPGGPVASRRWPCRQLAAPLAGRAATRPVRSCLRGSVVHRPAPVCPWTLVTSSIRRPSVLGLVPASSWVGRPPVVGLVARQFLVARKHWGPSPANSQVVGLSPHVGRAGPS